MRLLILLLSLAAVLCITTAKAQQIEVGDIETELNKKFELDKSVQVSWKLETDRLIDVGLNVMLSKLMGMPLLDVHGPEWPTVPVDAFHRKKRNVLVMILGVTSGELSLDINGASNPVSLNCEEGCEFIVDSILRGRRSEGNSRLSLMDICAQQYPSSRVISTSADRLLAKKFGTHSDESFGENSRLTTFFLNKKRREMMTNDGRSVSLEEAKMLLELNFNVTLDERVDHDALYLELATMLKHSEKTDEKCNGEDEACMYNYILTGIEQIGVKYGETSKEYLNALKLTREAVERALASFHTGDTDNLIFECIYLKSKTASIASLLHPVKPNILSDLPFFWDGDIDNSVASWHMAFWTSITLIMIIILIYLCMHSISEESRGSLLYRMTSISEHAHNNI